MNNHSTEMLDGQPWTRTRERWLLLTLAAIQFTLILDFLIIIPLGPQYMRVFSITPKQFSYLVAAYGISAGIAGMIAGFFLDKFDRKRSLLFLYFGFAIGTLFCGISWTYHLLVASRVVAGAFGGVTGAVILAIVGDVVPVERRGAAMGMVMSAFSVSSIVGVPAGLVIANTFGWHVPFEMLAVLSAMVLGFAAYTTPRLRHHLEHPREGNSFERTLEVMLHPDHQKAFIFMAALTCAGFFVFPYIAAYMVANVGLDEKRELPLVYLAGGLCTLFTMNWVGRWSDRSGKPKVFMISSLSAAIPILLITNLPRVPAVIAIAVSTLLMICMSARMVPAMAMMTAVVESRYRGGFMSINSAVQQFSMGVTSMLGGYILGEKANHELTHFPINGLISIVCAYSCIYLARFLKSPAPGGVPATESLPVEV